MTLTGLRPAPSIISSGDPSLNANVGIQDAADAKCWLAERIGKLRLAQSLIFAANSATDSAWDSWSTNTGLTPSTWTADPNFQNYTAGTPLCAAATLDVVPNAQVDLEFTGAVDNQITGAGGLRLAFYYQVLDYGITPTFASAARMTGGGILVNPSTGTAGRVGVHVRGSIGSIGAGGRGQQFAFWLAAYTAGTAYNLIGDRLVTAKAYYPQA
jgi:hypothetical protein